VKNQQPTRATIKTLFIAMLLGSVLIALIATFLPHYVDLDDETAMIMRIAFYAAAALLAKGQVDQAAAARGTQHWGTQDRRHHSAPMTRSSRISRASVAAL
jgi:hypothetical protein